MLDKMDLSSSLLSSTWCKPAYFMERHMKMLVYISKTFWRFVALSLSRGYPRTPFYSAFPILTLGEGKAVVLRQQREKHHMG
jgi:hypothetical protein